jgi:anti-sigma factor RsiW
MKDTRPRCRAMLAAISAYFDGDLAAPECAAIDAHCAGCPSCASLVEGLQKTVGLCRGVAEAPLPESVRKRARESVGRLLDEAARDEGRFAR